MSEQKQEKQYVSRRDYLSTQRVRLFGAIIALSMGALSCIIFYYGVQSMYDIFLIDRNDDKYSPDFLVGTGVVIICISVFFGWFILSLAKYIFSEMRAIDPGIPITPANIGNLPTDESLVRASQEPEQLQQSVLLRATQSNNTPSEELLRPTEAEEAPIKQHEQTPVDMVNVAARNE